MGLTYFLKKCIKYFGDIMKINEGSLTDNNIVLDTLEVFLDNTTFYILSGYGAFAMCGALNVDVYNTPKMASRRVCVVGESYTTKSSAESAANSVVAFYQLADIVEIK